eukprot:scaffold1514_cov113-Skeletonema_dohrnii-CCMP3373.AAC.2
MWSVWSYRRRVPKGSTPNEQIEGFSRRRFLSNAKNEEKGEKRQKRNAERWGRWRPFFSAVVERQFALAGSWIA